MIALDLDGTLLNEKKELTERTRHALEAAAERGLAVVISTGRPVTAIPKELKELPCIRYAVTADGARIEDLCTGELLHEALIPREMVKPIYDVFDQFDTIEEIYIDGRGYVSEWALDVADQYTPNPASANYLRETRIPVPDVHDLMDHDIDKAHALFKTVEDREEAKRRIGRLGDLVLCDAFMINLEVSAPGVDKGSGLKALGGMLGITTDQIMAFGDSNNDACMLEAAGISVCMDNGEEAIKKTADIIAPSNEEDGVAVVLERMLQES